MEQEQELEALRQEARQGILDLQDQVPLAWVTKQLGRAFKPNSLGYWLSVIVFLNLILLVPLVLAAMTWEDFAQLSLIWKANITAVGIVTLGAIMAHFAAQILLEDTANKIVPKVDSADDLSKLLAWLRNSWSPQSVSMFVLPFFIFWAALSTTTASIFLRQFIGIRFMLAYIPTGILAGLALYIPIWTNFAVANLKNYRYEMNAFSPADSEILSAVSGMMSKGIYMQAAVLGVITLVSTSSLISQEFRTLFSLPILGFAWLAIITQYLLTHSTLETITQRTKWKTLNKIQARINQIEATGDLSDQETAERLLRLVDIHKQVLASKADRFDLKSFSTLFSQLMLPLLGLLLGNFDKLMQLLNK